MAPHALASLHLSPSAPKRPQPWSLNQHRYYPNWHCPNRYCIAHGCKRTRAKLLPRMSADIRILLVDDHAIVREGVRALCEDIEGLQVVGEADDGDTALAFLTHTAVDVALVDFKMPGMPTAQLVERITTHWPSCSVIIFTSYADDQALLELTRAGATGYLLKNVQRHELISAIRAVATGQPWLHHAMHAQMLALLRQKPSADPYADLSPRERSVLRLLGQGVSNRQIAAALTLTEGTVKGYVSNVLRKLNLDQRAQAVLLVAQQPVADAE